MSSAHYHLAQVNIARMLAPLDSPLMAGFAPQLPIVNAIADRTPGFVWRLQTEAGDATALQAYEDPLVLFNMSVWESIEALKQFTYAGSHLTPMRDRTKWFERPTQAHLAFWWIPAGHIPTVEEGVERLDYRRVHGDSPIAFSFSSPQPAPEAPAAEPVPPPVNLDQRWFASASNTPNGDAGGQTRFHYRQQGARVWATYRGGRVRFGALVGVGDRDGRLDIRYHHVNPDGDLRTGACLTQLEPLASGRIRLIEDWQWTNGDLSRGHSVLEELDD